MRQPSGSPILTTKSADAIVGVMFKTGKGTALALPPVEYDEDKFTAKDKKGELIWTKEAIAFGEQLIAALFELDRALRADSEVTPAPEWVSRPEFALKAEQEYESAVQTIEANIERLRAERDATQAKAAEAARLRDLLFESGKPLEAAILRALKAMQFSATPFVEDGSEFDAVFASPEGRFIGEAEGKNDKAISIEKLDQLERNIREDFARQATGTYAKGVLFGNAYRLRDLSKRPDFFTEKCCTAATRGRVALVRTPDLFPITQYLEENADDAFATACRKAILETEGTIVRFPAIPAKAGGSVPSNGALQPTPAGGRS